MVPRSALDTVALSLALVTAVSPRVPAQNAQPSIRITTVPMAGPGGEEMQRIVGTTTNAPAGARVVLFAHTDKWYVQPYASRTDTAPTAPYTTLDKNGRWESDTHLGAEYAALLVKRSEPPYRPPSATGVLPALGGDILAITRVAARR